MAAIQRGYVDDEKDDIVPKNLEIRNNPNKIGFVEAGSCYLVFDRVGRHRGSVLHTCMPDNSGIQKADVAEAGRERHERCRLPDDGEPDFVPLVLSSFCTEVGVTKSYSSLLNSILVGLSDSG
jgi:hypothetical protein